MVPTRKLIAAFDLLDPGRDASFKKVTDAAWAFNDGYKFIKDTPDGGGIYTGIASINSINNHRILRLADVKLFAAEAFLQTEQPEKALERVNDIGATRKRKDAKECKQKADSKCLLLQMITMTGGPGSSSVRTILQLSFLLVSSSSL